MGIYIIMHLRQHLREEWPTYWSSRSFPVKCPFLPELCVSSPWRISMLTRMAGLSSFFSLGLRNLPAGSLCWLARVVLSSFFSLGLRNLPAGPLSWTGRWREKKHLFSGVGYADWLEWSCRCCRPLLTEQLSWAGVGTEGKEVSGVWLQAEMEKFPNKSPWHIYGGGGRARKKKIFSSLSIRGSRTFDDCQFTSGSLACWCEAGSHLYGIWGNFGM